MIMILNLGFPCISRHFHPSQSLSSSSSNSGNCTLLYLLFGNAYKFSSFNNLILSKFSDSSRSMRFKAKSSTSESEVNTNSKSNSYSELFGDDSDELLNRVSSAKDADEALEMIAEMCERSGGVVDSDDCCSIISAALQRNNADLALSIFSAMPSSFDRGNAENGSSVERWKWSRPNVYIYTSLIRGLAASLRVSDALRMISAVCRVGVSPGEEVPFGKIVRCPSCMIAIAVAQPQHGIQLVSCSKCRYQYELVSGDIIRVEAEEISMDIPAWKRGLRFLQVMKQSIPAAVHSIVVETPSGTARTHRFATETVELPAQEGERVTIALAAPSNAYREVGPFKFSPKTPNFYPGEPMCLTNHNDGRESLLLRAPLKDGGSPLLNPSIIVPLLAVLATGDAASGIIDPSLPQFISVAAVASLGLGATLNTVVLPQLNRLPQKMVDAIAIKQQLLSQYDTLQSRIKDLKESAEREVWMLARMCQLENKIVAVGEPSYRYARISSMIEIEVELDSDVLAADASNAESIAEQIEQTMELEHLEERWRLQAEANDEVERLLRSQPLPTEQL